MKSSKLLVAVFLLIGTVAFSGSVGASVLISPSTSSTPPPPARVDIVVPVISNMYTLTVPTPDQVTKAIIENYAIIWTYIAHVTLEDGSTARLCSLQGCAVYTYTNGSWGDGIYKSYPPSANNKTITFPIIIIAWPWLPVGSN